MVKSRKLHEAVTRESNELSAAEKQLILNAMKIRRSQVTNAKPNAQTLPTLRYIESAVIQAFNEESGPDTEKFWRRISEAGLDFRRRDVVRDILERDRIKDRIEYDIVVDTADTLADMGKVTPAEAKRLQQLVARFERDERV